MRLALLVLLVEPIEPRGLSQRELAKAVRAEHHLAAQLHLRPAAAERKQRRGLRLGRRWRGRLNRPPPARARAVAPVGVPGLDQEEVVAVGQPGVRDRRAARDRPDPSSEQRNVAPASFASNVRVAVVWSVVPEGPEVIVTCMDGLASAVTAGNARSTTRRTRRTTVRRP